MVLFELAALRTPFTSKNVYQLCDEVPGRNDCRGNGVDGLIRIASSPALMCLCVCQIMTQPTPSLRRWYSSALDDMVRAMLHKQELHRPSAKQVHLSRLALLVIGATYVDCSISTSCIRLCVQILRMSHFQWHLCRFRDELASSSSAGLILGGLTFVILALSHWKYQL